jgi:hypothetical protein
MAHTLIVQVLGNSDVHLNGKKAAEHLKEWECTSEEDLREIQESIEADCENNINQLDFPMIRLLNQEIQIREQDSRVTFCFLLTNQRQWLKERHQDDPDIWREFGHTDGLIWQKVLVQWCKMNQIDCIWLELKLGGHVTNGVADWEKIAPIMTELLNSNFVSSRNNLYNSHRNLSIDKFYIQHSSGTPALCSALYLWGIEQKLANRNVEFVYISRESVNRNEDSFNFHRGSHWQWRLVAPQIEQLLELQDFSGACELVNSSVFENARVLQRRLKNLDRLISFNLIDIRQNLSLNEQVIERIAIALWSEKGFRQRGQWMHWILRMSGAFELTCNHYLVQNQEDYYWRERDFGICLWNKTISENEKFWIPISILVKDLLTTGKYNYKSTNLICSQLKGKKWFDFVEFYCGDYQGWQVSRNFELAFSKIRNDLYHNLMGDKLDQILDAKTNEFESNGGVFNKNHPAQVAVQQLRTLLEITNLAEAVDTSVEKYQSQVKSIKEDLLE